MHILESLALNCGLKIDKPFIYEKIAPVEYDNYIVLDANDKSDAKNYNYWQEVLFILKPYLTQENIKVIQLIENENEQILLDAIPMIKLDFSQKAYLIKNSKLFVGIDSLNLHLASSYDKPIVALFSNTSSNNSGPFFNVNNKPLILNGYKNKPSYLNIENPKSINSIYPEVIAKGILNKLDIKDKITKETVYVGNMFHASIAEMVPNMVVDIQKFNIPFINIRMDYLFNENILIDQLSISKSVILTNKPINLDIYNKYKQNILKIIYFIDENTDFNHLEKLNKLNINFDMVSLNPIEDNVKFKINTMEYGFIIEDPLGEKVKEYNKLNSEKNLKFRSNKLLLSDGKVYPSYANFKLNIPFEKDNLEEMEFIYNEDSFANDINHLLIFKS